MKAGAGQEPGQSSLCTARQPGLLCSDLLTPPLGSAPCAHPSKCSLTALWGLAQGNLQYFLLLRGQKSQVSRGSERRGK